MHVRLLFAVAGLLVAAGLTMGAEKTEARWSYLRGPDSQGGSDDKNVPLKWSEKENILWKTELPGGYGNASPVVWGDKIFLTTCNKDGNERHVCCVQASTGKVLWKELCSKGVPPGKTHNWNGFASATCATDGKYVFAFFGTPGLFCYDMDGKKVWDYDFGVFTSQAGWGTAASPFVYEDLVIMNCDNDGKAGLPQGSNVEKVAPMSLVALEKATGKIRWETPRNQGRGFSTPRLMTMPDGRIDLVLNGPLGVCGYDPKTGKELWTVKRTDAGDQNRFGEPIPVSDGKVLYAPSGRPGPFQAIKLGGSGDVTKTHVAWQITRKGHRDVSSQILAKDWLFAADTKGMLTCYDPKTGKELYNERLANNKKSLGSPVLVRGMMLFVLDDGETVLVEPAAEFKVVGRNVLGDGKELDFGASPAIADGKLYLRSQKHLYCIGEKK